MRLAMTLTGQSGFEITNFSPTKVVAGVLRFLNFKELDERIQFFPNLPPMPGWASRARVTSDPKEIQAALSEDLARIYRDHAAYPWLQYLLLESQERQCLVVFKRTRVKSLSGAKILYLSDRALYAKYLRAVSGALLLRFGLGFTQVESRFLERTLALSKQVGGYNKKLFLSQELSAAQIDYVYSESMCFDL
jgi:hypothetical protein